MEAGKVSDLFTKVEHEVPLKSLQDVFSYSEIYDFEKRARKGLNLDIDKEENTDVEYVVETKIDGLSIALEYNRRKTCTWCNKGWSEKFGEDVTANILHIKDIPHEISYSKKLIVRGEIYLPYKEFEELNIRNEEQGKKNFENPRNAASRNT